MTVNWGILGAASFARQHMGPAIQLARGARIAGLASASPDKVAGFRDLAPDLRHFDSYDALIADPGIDAVYIPLPNHLHRDWTLKALDAGKHVLCEKPLCMKAADFDAVIEKRDATGLLAAEAFMIVHHPQWQLARDLVQGGKIGPLAQIDVAFSYDNSADVANIRNRAETGGGSLPDIGVYTIGGPRFVTGAEPKGVVHADITMENGVDTTARAVIAFDGFTLNSMTSMRLVPRQEVVFHGARGVVRLTAPYNPGVFGEATVRLETPPEVREWRFPDANHYVAQVEAFGAALDDPASYPCPLEFSRGTQAVLDQIFKAAAS